MVCTQKSIYSNNVQWNDSGIQLSTEMIWQQSSCPSLKDNVTKLVYSYFKLNSFRLMRGNMLNIRFQIQHSIQEPDNDFKKSINTIAPPPLQVKWMFPYAITLQFHNVPTNWYAIIRMTLLCIILMTYVATVMLVCRIGKIKMSDGKGQQR